MAKKRADYEVYRKLLKDMEVGHSFFEDGKTTKQLFFLRQIAHRAGVKISMHNVECDEIYNRPGVRVWREKTPDEKA